MNNFLPFQCLIIQLHFILWASLNSRNFNIATVRNKVNFKSPHHLNPNETNYIDFETELWKRCRTVPGNFIISYPREGASVKGFVVFVDRIIKLHLRRLRTFNHILTLVLLSRVWNWIIKVQVILLNYSQIRNLSCPLTRPNVTMGNVGQTNVSRIEQKIIKELFKAFMYCCL